MPCESCAVQFSVFKRKRICSECDRYYCSNCLRRGGGIMCAPCRLLSTKPLYRGSIAHLKVRDLQCFLHRQSVSTRGCVEKEELLRLCILHVNNASYKRRAAGGGAGRAGAFTFKGITNNINDLITSAFDMRNQNSNTRPQSSDCFNGQHAHSSPTSQPSQPPHPERFSATPGGETRIEVPVPAPTSPPASSGSVIMDTADCLEVEDLDDSSWELLNVSTDALPNDSDVLITVRVPPQTPRRRASSADLDIRRPDAADARDSADSASVHEEAMEPNISTNQLPSSRERAPAGERVQLDGLRGAEELERLSARQLKELLARNRVGFRGCVERHELLERARTLLHDHLRYKDVEQLPESEVCKICMSAPVECVLLECGHLAACTACAARLPDCPLCRRYVVRAVRVFRA